MDVYGIIVQFHSVPNRGYEPQVYRSNVPTYGCGKNHGFNKNRPLTPEDHPTNRGETIVDDLIYTYIHTSMYVCMYVCMTVCRYVGM